MHDSSRGTTAFDRGVDAIRSWHVHTRAGLEVASDGPITVGTNVALSPPTPIGFVEATCRIDAGRQEPNRFGFA